MTKYAWLKILEDLEDQHINFAQKLLAIQFLSMEGFHNTLLQTKIPSRKINIGLQVEITGFWLQQFDLTLELLKYVKTLIIHVLISN